MKGLKFKLLHECSFTSSRKRQSVIIREPEELGGNIRLICKGADSAIKSILSQKDLDSQLLEFTEEWVDLQASEGLRTLFLATRTIDQKEFEEWDEQVKKHQRLVLGREQQLANDYNQIEANLTLVGSTAIADRLQDEVADTIKFMKRAGIKVWVLTGDKIGTAINIGFAAGLLEKDIKQHQVDKIDKATIKTQLAKVKEDISNEDGKHAIIIHGNSLIEINKDKELLDNFCSISNTVDVVLACRVSPQQKADIVEMIRKRYPKKVTLAVGDGANDVSMILSSHVGVGILGREG